MKEVIVYCARWLMTSHYYVGGNAWGRDGRSTVRVINAEGQRSLLGYLSLGGVDVEKDGRVSSFRDQRVRNLFQHEDIAEMVYTRNSGISGWDERACDYLDSSDLRVRYLWGGSR
jgi:hypothetical protein